MAEHSREELRNLIRERVGEELKKTLDQDPAFPEYARRAMVDEVCQLGDEEIEYNIRRLVRRAKKNQKRIAEKAKRRRSRTQSISRFSLYFRIQHAMVAASVLLLIVTGVPIKFHDTGIGSIISTLGLVHIMGITHRIAAAIMALGSILHILWVIFTPDGWRTFVDLLPRLHDFRDFYQLTRALLGFTKERPRFERFNFIEKFDYWAVYWGVVIMLGTGVLLAFNTYFMNQIGSYSMRIATLIHSDEALLASLALLIWHMYWAHFNPDKFPMNRTFLTGTMTMDEMIEEHPAELERRVKLGEIPLIVLEGHPEWAQLHPRMRKNKSESSDGTGGAS